MTENHPENPLVDPDLDNDTEETPEEYTEDTNGKTETVELYDAAQGKLPRDGGPYLDEIERRNAEEIRAQKENREPDYDNPPAVAGTRLVPKEYLTETDASYSHRSAAAEVENEPVAKVEVDVSSGFDVEPDDKQVDWDHDSQKVAAAEAKQRYDNA